MKSERFTVELTEDEVSLVSYALREMGNRRLEQSVDPKWKFARNLSVEAQKHYDLAERIYQSLSRP